MASGTHHARNTSGALPICLALVGFLGYAGSAVASDDEMPTGTIHMVEDAKGANVVHTVAPSATICTASGWMFGGGASADFNNNGLPDLYIVGGTGNADALFINNGDGTFTDEAAAWGVELMHCGTGAAAGDYDNDGWTDVFLCSTGDLADGTPMPSRNKLLRNSSRNSFMNVTAQAGLDVTHTNHYAHRGACWGDYNLDGFLDLHIARWNNPSLTSLLFRNEGNGAFTDVTVTSGVVDSATWSFQGAFADMNDDGWPDLLLASDYETSRYYANNGDGTFTGLTPENGTGIESNGMGQTIADFDNDTQLDWYVTSVYPEWMPDSHPGNTLYQNVGNHQFVEIGHQANVHDGRWGWGALAVDLDHDGLVDIVEVNGRPAHPYLLNPPRVFRNLGGMQFEEIAADIGMGDSNQGRGVIRLDAERNGMQDVVMICFNQPVRYFRNQSQDIGSWIGLTLDTSNNPYLAPHGFNSRVTATIGEATQTRYVNGEPSYLATSELNVHFGLGDAEVIDTLTINWPRGYMTVMHDVPVNHYLAIQSPALADLNGDGVTNVQDMLELLGRWGTIESALDLKADTDNDGTVGVFDLLTLLQNWSG